MHAFVEQNIFDIIIFSISKYWCKELNCFPNSCVPNDQCQGQLDVRGAGDDYYDDYSTPTCDDDSHTCCHDSKRTELKEGSGPKQCSEAGEEYR